MAVESLPIEIVPAVRPVDADVRVPGSKSYTNRALLIAALAEGTSRLHDALFSEDTAHMADCLARLGIAVEATLPAPAGHVTVPGGGLAEWLAGRRAGEDVADAAFLVHGQGGRLPAAEAALFVGNSGTTVRFLTAAAALGHGRYTLDGVPRMRERPIEALLDGLRQLGVEARSVLGTGCPPVEVRAAGLRGGRARMAGGASSQYFSALLMAAPLATGDTEIEVEGDLVSKPYLDMTAASMAAFGATMVNEGYRRFRVPGRAGYRARDYRVEPDASAASYFFAAAAVTGGRACVPGLDRASAQGDLRLVDIFQQMGCAVTWGAGWVEVRGPAGGRLRGVDVDVNALSDMVQTLAAVAPFADGPVTIRQIGHIRHKETDRLAAVATELHRLGVPVSLSDPCDCAKCRAANARLAALGIPVEAGESRLTIAPAAPRPADIQTYGDHRMAMSFAVTGLRAPGIRLHEPGCVAKTFPDFFARFAALTAP